MTPWQVVVLFPGIRIRGDHGCGGEPEEDLFPLGPVSVQGLWSPGGHAY